MTDIEKLIERMRILEANHEPNQWPSIRMRDISALCDAVDDLVARNVELKRLAQALLAALEGEAMGISNVAGILRSAKALSNAIDSGK